MSPSARKPAADKTNRAPARGPVPELVELRPPLPTVVGNCDYQRFEQHLRRMDELLLGGGLEWAFINRRMQAMEQHAEEQARRCDRPSRPWSAQERRRTQQMLRLALRCNLARQWTEKEYRPFSRRLAESQLLRWFCQIERLDAVRVPSKSSLQRYEALAPEEEVRALVEQLNRCAADPRIGRRHPLRLQQPAGLELYFADTSCLRAHIHMPVDWVLLRDAARTLMKSIVVIRRHGLLHRMPPPEQFLQRMNRLCIQMTHCRRQKDGRRQRKGILRRMKRLARLIAAHGQRYVKLLEREWSQTDLTEGQMRCIQRRMQRILDQLPAAIRQAHERLIGGRLLPNAQKTLSLYEEDVHVIVRGKASAEVEFGNTLYLAEQQDGLIVDWRLCRDTSPGDTALLAERLVHFREVYGRDPDAIGADRGFDSAAIRAELSQREIYNGVCPRSLAAFKQRWPDEAFEAMHRRRSQTEARIAIVQRDFLGLPLRSKGFASRELAVGWAVLAHNLWVLARLPVAQVRRKKAAA